MLGAQVGCSRLEILIADVGYTRHQVPGIHDFTALEGFTDVDG
jgi:hypothetical protein